MKNVAVPARREHGVGQDKWGSDARSTLADRSKNIYRFFVFASKTDSVLQQKRGQVLSDMSDRVVLTAG